MMSAHPLGEPLDLRHEISGWHRPLLFLAAGLGVFAVVCVGGLVFDHRVLVGAPIWMKPLKFSVSVLIFATTMAWLLSLLHSTPRLARYVGNTIVGVGVIEITAITVQVIRGQQSHFNYTTPLNSAIFGVMGFMITVLWCSSIVVVVMALRQRLGNRLLASALRSGLGLSVAGMAVGFLMAGPTAAQRAGGFTGIQGAHSVGVPDSGPGLPITGWSTVGGDLRVPHFFGLHAFQMIPLAGWLLVQAGRRWGALRAEAVQVGLVRVAAFAYGCLLALLIWQAERGQSLIHPDRLTLEALVVIVAATLAGAAAVVVRGRRRLPAGNGHAVMAVSVITGPEIR
jgi:hypothetical protein